VSWSELLRGHFGLLRLASPFDRRAGKVQLQPSGDPEQSVILDLNGVSSREETQIDWVFMGFLAQPN
jgi:hypothetical protein